MELLLYEPSNMHKNVSKPAFCNKQPISALTFSFTKFMKVARCTQLCGQEVTKCLKESEVGSPHHVHSTLSSFWLALAQIFAISNATDRVLLSAVISQITDILRPNAA